jgi:hypothetical protein
LWLEQEGYPKLERTSQGNFIVSSEIMTLFKRDVSEQQMLNGNNVIFSIETRRYYLMLMLFSIFQLLFHMIYIMNDSIFTDL